MASKNDKVTAEFDRERETKNYVRFSGPDDPNAPVMGTVYVHKSVLGDSDNVATITVVIER